MLMLTTRKLPVHVVLACCFASATVAALSVALLSPERWLAAHAAAPTGGTDRILADEASGSLPSDFDKSHLRYSSAAEVKPISGDLHEGDHISIGGSDGLKRVLKVVSLERMTVRARRSDARGATSEFIEFTVVTAQDLDAPNSAPVRLILEDGRSADRRTKTASSPAAL